MTNLKLIVVINFDAAVERRVAVVVAAELLVASYLCIRGNHRVLSEDPLFAVMIDAGSLSIRG